MTRLRHRSMDDISFRTEHRGRTMPIIDSLRMLVERRADVMIVAGNGELRLMALTWDDHEKSRGFERVIPTNDDDIALQQALDELLAELPRVKHYDRPVVD